MKKKYNEWLLDRFKHFSESPCLQDEIFIPRLELSFLKPIHAKWIIEVYEEIKKRENLIHDCWRLCGLSDIINQVRNGENLIYPYKN